MIAFRFGSEIIRAAQGIFPWVMLGHERFVSTSGVNGGALCLIHRASNLEAAGLGSLAGSVLQDQRRFPIDLSFTPARCWPLVARSGRDCFLSSWRAG